MRKSFAVTAVAGLVLAAGTWVIVGYRQSVDANATLPAEYSVSLLASSLTDAGHNNLSRYLFASRTDGSTAFVHEQMNQAGAVIHRSRKLSLSDGRFVQIHEPMNVMTVEQNRHGAAFRFFPQGRSSSSNCEKGLAGDEIQTSQNFRLVGNERISGVDAAHLKSTTGKPEIEQWFAPKFGCALVGELIRYEFAGANGQTRYGSETKQLEWIKPVAEPALFAVPAYEQLQESQVRERLQDYFRNCPNCQ